MAANTRALPVMATIYGRVHDDKTSGEELSSIAESFALFEFEYSVVYFKSFNFSR